MCTRGPKLARVGEEAAVTHETGGENRHDPYLETMREEWEMLLAAARRRGYRSTALSSYIDGLVDGLDTDRAFGILEAVTGTVEDDWRRALECLLADTLLSGGR
jgi:hypothetical protein